MLLELKRAISIRPKKDMFKLVDKKLITILCSFCLSWHTQGFVLKLYIHWAYKLEYCTYNITDNNIALAVTSVLQIRVRIGKLFSLFLIQNICCGYS